MTPATSTQRAAKARSRQRQSRENLRLCAPRAAEIIALAARISAPDERTAITERAVEIWNLALVAEAGNPLEGEEA